MGKMYRFAAMVRRYAMACGPVELWTETEGCYDPLGEWAGATPVSSVIVAALAPYSERQILQSGGALSQKDRQMFCAQSLGEDLTKCKVCAGSEVYTVKEATGTGQYADVWVYALAWVERLSPAGQEGGRNAADG